MLENSFLLVATVTIESLFRPRIVDFKLLLFVTHCFSVKRIIPSVSLAPIEQLKKIELCKEM